MLHGSKASVTSKNGGVGCWARVATDSSLLKCFDICASSIFFKKLDIEIKYLINIDFVAKRHFQNLLFESYEIIDFGYI